MTYFYLVVKMSQFWGKLRLLLSSRRILGYFRNFLHVFVKFGFILALVPVKVLTCPLSSYPSGASTITELIHRNHNSRQDGEINTENTTELSLSFDTDNFGESVDREKRAAYLPSSFFSSPMLSAMVAQVIKFVVRNFLGGNWLSEEAALRRWDDWKTSLNNYFEGNVEQPRSGIGFPSLEGAVLSLAFLTFSVFLIDLIQTILNRMRMRGMTIMMTPATPPPTGGGATGRAFSGPANIAYVDFLRHNFTRPFSQDTLTTLSSTVLSAIEKPWNKP